MRRARSFLFLVLLIVPCAAAEAQEKGQVGLTLGYPASIGLMLHATDGVAIRPEVSLSHSSSDSTATGATQAGSSTSDSWGFGVGVSALFYLHTREKLRMFVAPRFVYGRTKTASSSAGSLSSSTLDSTTNSYTVTGSIGVQYAVSRWFSLIGEVGLDYTTRDSVSAGAISGSSATTRTYGTRTAIGAVFYLK